MLFHRREFVVIAAVAMGFVLSILAWLFLPTFYGPARPWGAYATIVTDLPAHEAEGLLHAAGIEDTVSEHSTMVSLTRFAAVVEEPLSSVLARLDARDPRLDEYIGRLMRYFRSDEQSRSTILYGVVGGSLSRAQRLVRNALGPGSRIAETRPGQMVISCALLLGLVGVILLTIRRNLLALLVGVIPWVPVAIGLGVPGAVAAAMVFFVWAWAVGDLRVSLITRVSMLAAVGVLSAISTSLSLGPRSLLPIVLAFVGTCSLTVGMDLLAWRMHQVREHELFRPVSILPGAFRIRVARSTLLLLPFLLAASLALPVLSERYLGSDRIVTPRPSDVASSDGLGWESLESLWRLGPSEGLPDLSDFVAHMAYQEGLMFGRAYAFPAANEQVEISRIAEGPDGAYEQFSEVMLSFDQAWLQKRLDAVPRGPAAMLRALRAPSGVVLSPERSLYSGHLQLFQHVMFVLLVFAPFMLGGLQWSVPGVRARVLEIAARTKRRRQVA